MSIERHRQREQIYPKQTIGPEKSELDLLIHEVIPSKDDELKSGFIFFRQVMYQPSRSAYMTRGVNSLEDLEMDCD
jgi:hypothetical protein